MEQLTVGKLAQQVGVSADTLRYYERIGLLPRPERSDSGYRLYGDEAVARVRLIRGAQRFGLRLEEIAEMLEIQDHGLCPCGHRRQMLQDKLARLDADMAELQKLRDEIRRIVDAPVDAGEWCSERFVPIRTAEHNQSE